MLTTTGELIPSRADRSNERSLLLLPEHPVEAIGPGAATGQLGSFIGWSQTYGVVARTRGRAAQSGRRPRRKVVNAGLISTTKPCARA